MSEIILNITAGDGPKECHWVTAKLAVTYVREAVKAGLSAEVLWEGQAGRTARAAVPSVLVKLSGQGAADFARPRIGTVRWIGQSPFRPHHKRKNWFVGVSKAPALADVPQLREADIAYQTLKASGPGGQHVNKTESAVRATHLPTGLTAVSQAQRSQFANKKLTRLKLALLLQERQLAAQSQRDSEMWTTHKTLERGNAVRVYEGPKFRLKA